MGIKNPIDIISFNPRTRKGCDIRYNFHFWFFSVSIHAPVKDATSLVWCTNLSSSGFNPRTRKGCDLVAAVSLLAIYGFNPRTRKGCDSMFMESFIDNIFSI